MAAAPLCCVNPNSDSFFLHSYSGKLSGAAAPPIALARLCCPFPPTIQDLPCPGYTKRGPTFVPLIIVPFTHAALRDTSQSVTQQVSVPGASAGLRCAQHAGLGAVASYEPYRGKRG